MHRGTQTITVAGDPRCRNVVYFLDMLPVDHTLSHTPNYINAVICDEALIKLFKKKKTIQQVSSVGKYTCHQIWWPEFSPKTHMVEEATNTCKLSLDHHTHAGMDGWIDGRTDRQTDRVSKASVVELMSNVMKLHISFLNTQVNILRKIWIHPLYPTCKRIHFNPCFTQHMKLTQNRASNI